MFHRAEEETLLEEEIAKIDESLTMVTKFHWHEWGSSENFRATYPNRAQGKPLCWTNYIFEKS